MNSVTVRYSVPFYAICLLFLVPGGFALLDEIAYFWTHGHFRSGTGSFLALVFGLLFVFSLLWVAPAYRVVLSDAGINQSHRITILGIKFFEFSGTAPWENVVGLDWHSVGWMWGLVLTVRFGDKFRGVWLNRYFTSKREALRLVVSKVPAEKISDKAKRKLSRMGLVTA
jgi:hypothetical protein